VGTGSIWYNEGAETNEGGLNRFDKNTGKFIRYLHDPKNPHSLIDNKVRSIFEDSRGTFWVGTAGDGLHTMNRINGEFERHTYDPAHPEKLSRPPQLKSSLAKDAITFITEDITGAIWIGTFFNGINRYDYKTNKVKFYPNFKDPVSGIQTKWASYAYNSSDGMLWIGYWEGIFLINPLQNVRSYFNTEAVVNDILEDTDSMIWYSTRNGLIRKDQNTGTERRFVSDPNNPRSISSNNINGIYEDRQGILWIGTANGLNRFDRKKDEFTHMSDEEVDAIYEDRHGSFWLGTRSGLVLMDRKNGSFENFFYNPGDIKSWGNNLVYSICEDKHGDLWIGGFNGGVNRFIPQTKKFQRFLKGLSVFSLWADSKGILWAGTSAGLYQSNLSLSSFSRFKDSNLCLRENTMICGLLEDDQKCLWINTLEGIYRLNQSRNEVVRYSNSKREGKWGYETLGCHMGKRKGLLFGSDGGYYIFFPEQLTKNSNHQKLK
jgi:ligand-binding sensor domain-containing protein